MGELDSPDAWIIARSYIQDYGLISSQIDSFNRFVNPQGIEEIIKQTGPIDVTSDGTNNKLRYRIEFGKVTISRPTVTEKDGIKTRLMPKEARLRRLTYSAKLYVSITKVSYENGDCITETGRQTVNLNIGQIPIMVGSDRCNSKLFSTVENMGCIYDPGGYFIVNGNERTIVAQEKKATNKLLIFKKGPETFVAEVVSVSPHPTKPPITTYIRATLKKERMTIYVNLPFIRGDIPIFFLLRALGITTDKTLNILCTNSDAVYEKIIEPMLGDISGMSSDDCLEWVGRRINSTTVGIPGTKESRIENAKTILDREFFSHAAGACNNEKAILLGYCVRRLLAVITERETPHDRDHLDNKRLDVTGPLLSQVFRLLYRKLQKDIKDYIVKCINTGKNFNLIIGVRQDSITRGLKYCIATGLWNIGRGNYQKARTGVSQIKSVMNYVSSISHLKRCDTGAGKDGKSAKPRMLHGSQYGMNCPAETPEGQPCGLVKAQTILQYTSDEIPNESIYIINVLRRHPKIFIDIDESPSGMINLYMMRI